MMWRRRKDKPVSPEVQAAMDTRDELLEDVGQAVEKVDRLQADLLEEYRQANGVKEKHDAD